MAIKSSCAAAIECGHPRRIYVDAGVNWGNTARLFESFDDASSGSNKASWEVFGFEAAPLIQPWADAYFSWLDGSSGPPAETCLPKSGSTRILNLYATAHGCPRYPRLSTHLVERMLKCMETRLAPHLQALRPAPHLNSSSLVMTRLSAACPPKRCDDGQARYQLPRGGEFGSTSSASRHARYTFIPAAAASSTDVSMRRLERWAATTSPSAAVTSTCSSSRGPDPLVVTWLDRRHTSNCTRLRFPCCAAARCPPPTCSRLTCSS